MEGATDASQNAPDVSPLQAQREWVQQAEDNVVQRLYEAGLIDAPSEFDQTLELLANNILAYNKIATDRPLKVRTLLTEPLETLSVGNTILISEEPPGYDRGTFRGRQTGRAAGRSERGSCLPGSPHPARTSHRHQVRL